MTNPDLGLVPANPRSPGDRLENGVSPSYTLADFWTWAMSDLLVNTNRGLFAEFIVARALGDISPVRDPWRPFDVVTGEGIRVEVKSGAYLQAWAQKKHSDITFSIAPTTAWDGRTGDFVGDRGRQAEVYVFALISHRDKATVNPADLSQWSFYAVSTRWLDVECGTAKSVTLKRLEKLGVTPVRLEELAGAVRAAANFR